MTITGEDPCSTWKDSHGNVVQIPDSLNDMSEYISSVLEAAEIADVSTELRGLAHEDVTLHIDSETDGQIREVVFKPEIENWKEHTGGKSTYSAQDMVDYEVEPGDAEPTDYVHAMGAFFHKLENKMSDMFHKTTYNRPMFKLEDYDESSVVFRGSVSLHRYDYH